VQGGGCLTVGLAGLVQGGGFGSFSKRYGSAAASLLEAEVVTADGTIRIANGCTNRDLFWALKGGGGGTFGVVSKLTLRLHELPEYFGIASLTIKAGTDADYRLLISEFVAFYRDSLFNDHWGEQAHFSPENTLEIRMLSCGLSADQAKKTWQPFLDLVAHSRRAFAFQGSTSIGSIPARHFWDVDWWKQHWPEVALPSPAGNPFVGLLEYGLTHLMPQPIFDFDRSPGGSPSNAWWKANTGEAGWYIWGYESVWLPSPLLQGSARQRLADALFESSRYSAVELHFNKGLAGAPPEVIAAAEDTATNPAVLSAFALAIASAGESAAYPGIPGHEPAIAEGRAAAARIHRCMNRLRAVAGQTAAYVSESNYFEQGWQHSYWGANYPRLAAIKRRYDPDGLFFVHNGVGSEGWSRDGFTRR
jgi:FAD/FMN-containing dehydrogenase